MESLVALPVRISSTLFLLFFSCQTRDIMDLEGIKGCLIDLLS